MSKPAYKYCGPSSEVIPTIECKIFVILKSIFIEKL
jgi:hypothetical protein